MANMLNLANRQRDALTDQEQQARLALATEYEQAYRAIQADLADVERLISEAGEHASRVWLQQQRTYTKLLAGIDEVFGDYGSFVEGNILQQQTRAAAQALTDTDVLLKAGKVKPATFKSARLSSMIAGVQERVVKLELPKTLPAAVKDTVKQTAQKALASTQRLTDNARKGIGGILANVMTTHQTETMHAYRLVGQQVAQANGVQQWQWAARLNKRPAPCAMCIAQHGKLFAITVPFGSHPHCFCIAVPVVGNGVPIEQTGAAWFAQQPAAVQRDVLGRKKFDLFTAGQITLDDTVGYKVDPEWGVVRWERSAQAMGFS
jgi:hypothetical protein